MTSSAWITFPPTFIEKPRIHSNSSTPMIVYSMSFISFLILDGIGSEQLRFGAALQTHWLKILRVGNLTHENFRWHRYSPLFQIARRSLITPTMCRTNPRSEHHAKTQSNIEQPGEEADPMMGSLIRLRGYRKRACALPLKNARSD
jgi:hypothetical protein